jgi:hypothetical protein
VAAAAAPAKARVQPKANERILASIEYLAINTNFKIIY